MVGRYRRKGTEAPNGICALRARGGYGSVAVKRAAALAGEIELFQFIKIRHALIIALRIKLVKRRQNWSAIVLM